MANKISDKIEGIKAHKDSEEAKQLFDTMLDDMQERSLAFQQAQNEIKKEQLDAINDNFSNELLKRKKIIEFIENKLDSINRDYFPTIAIKEGTDYYYGYLLELLANFTENVGLKTFVKKNKNECLAKEKKHG